MLDGDFEALISWLHARLGQPVSVSMQRSPGNVRLHARGMLVRSQGDITLIEPARGRVKAFDIGDARIILLEGEFDTVEFDEPQRVSLPDGAIDLPARATAGFGDVQIVFGDVATS